MALTDLQRGYCLCLEPLTIGALLESERQGVSPARCMVCLAAIVGWAAEDEADERDEREAYEAQRLEWVTTRIALDATDLLERPVLNKRRMYGWQIQRQRRMAA